MKRPWFPFFAADWLVDPAVKAMSRTARSVYFDMLCLQWMNGPLPDDSAAIARMLGEDRRTISAVWEAVRARFEPMTKGECQRRIDDESTTNRGRIDDESTPILVQLRLESEANRAQFIVDKNRKAAKVRWTADATAYAPAMQPSNASGMLSQSQSQSQSQRTKEGKKQPPASPKAPPTEIFQVVEAWKTGWAERFKPVSGRAPEPDDVDWKQAKNLLGKHGLSATLGYLSRFLDDTDRLVAERGHMLRDLPSRIARYEKTQRNGQTSFGYRPPIGAQPHTVEEKL